MPALPPIVGNAISAIFNYFHNQEVQQQIEGAYALAKSIAQTLGDISQALINILSDERDAWQHARPLADGVASDLSLFADTENTLWSHLLDNIMPASQGWVIGYVFSTGIIPLRHAVSALQSAVRFLMGWRGQIDFWRKATVDPEIVASRNFRHWFSTWPLADLKILDDWIHRPQDLANFLAAPIIGPIIAYLADTHHTTSRDNLAQIMVEVWSDDVDPIAARINGWLTTPLSGG